MSLNSFVKFLKWKVSETKDSESLKLIPQKIVRYILTNRELTDEQKTQAKEAVRDWFKYVREHNFRTTQDLFTIRYHLAKFAEQNFEGTMPQEEFLVSDISNLSIYADEVAKFRGEVSREEFERDILNNKKVGYFGGTARLAAKMVLGLDIQSELPINDLDLIVSDEEEAKRLSEKYKIDLAGIKILNSANVEDEIEKFIANVDCTMNQVGVCNGKVFYSKRAEEDLRSGTIRLVCKVDPLFGTEGVEYEPGKIYMNRKGFYRTLSFLIRGKGNGVIVSKENIEAEKDNIGDYWLSILLVKVLPMKDKSKRETAVRNWYAIAKKIGSTQTQSPVEFLKELIEKDEEDKVASRFKVEFDNLAQVKWLVGKLVSKSAEYLFDKEKFVPPVTYTPIELKLDENSSTEGLTEFYELIEKLRQ